MCYPMTRCFAPRAIFLFMQSPFSLRNWILFILVNIVIATATAYIVVRMLTQAVSRPDPAMLGAPIAMQAPVGQMPVVAPPQASGVISATPQNVLQPAPTVAVIAAPANLQPGVAQPTPAAKVAAPISATANVRISTIVFAGQRGREAVVIVNEGDQIDLTGWTLTNPRGQSYTFGGVLLFKDSFINLHTTKGVDVPTDLFWNQDAPIWKKGDSATLKRGEQVMATFDVK